MPVFKSTYDSIVLKQQRAEGKEGRDHRQNERLTETIRIATLLCIFWIAWKLLGEFGLSK